MPAITKPEGISWTEIVRRTLKEVNEDDVLGRSAQLSYYFFLALFPMLISIISVMSLFGHADSTRQALLGFLAAALPVSASELIQKTLMEVIQGAGAGGLKLSFGIIFSLWSASAGMSAIMDTLNSEYEASESRSFLRRNATAMGLSIACAVLMVGAVSIVLAGGAAAVTIFSYGASATLLKIALWGAAAGLVLLAFALIYFFAPDVKDQKWHWVTPGALIALVLWLAVSVSLKTYLHFFDRYSATYGSLGAVIVLLLWFYLSGAAVLIGAEINSVLENAAAEAGEPDAKQKGDKAPNQKAAAAGAR